jgi:deoxyribonucleoside regulator
MNDRLRILYKIAYDYYVEKLKQKDIANRYNINRVQVSRYLKEAEEKGLIKIKVINPMDDEKKEIEDKFISKFPIKKAIIASTYSENIDVTIIAIVEEAIKYFNKVFEPTDKIGVGWGRTLYKISQEFKSNKIYPGIKFVPLAGGSLELDKEFQTNHISFMFAEKFKGKSLQLMAPFYLKSLKEYNTIIKNVEVKKIISMWGQLSKAIIGIGSDFYKTPLIKLGAFSEVELTKFLNHRQVGGILTNYFNLKGEFCELSIYKRLVNFPVKSLEEVEEVIAVAGGISKKYSIIGALRSGLIDTIILDSFTAQEIIKEV